MKRLPAVGDLLVAPPHMSDERFQETVILMTEINSKNCYGFAVNKPTDFSVNDCLAELEIDINLPLPLYWGGPVNHNSVWMLHSDDWGISSTVHTDTEWSLTSNERMFWEIAEVDRPRQMRFCHGICTWRTPQLEGEIQGDWPWHQGSSWLIVEQPEQELVMELPVDDVWHYFIEHAGQVAVDNWMS